MSKIKLLQFESLTSTSDYLKAQLKKLPIKLPLAVLAREQTAGRGRDSNKWVSEKDKGLYLSLLDRFDQQAVRLHHLRAALLAINALEQFGLKGLDLKWPNDLLYNNRKIGGILIENIFIQAECYSIIGIGINLNHQETDFPSGLRTPPVSLRMISGKECPPDELARVILNFYPLFFFQLAAEEIVKRANEYAQKFKNCPVKLVVHGKELQGIFKQIGQNGGLIVDQGEEIFYASSVWFDSSGKFF